MSFLIVVLTYFSIQTHHHFLIISRPALKVIGGDKIYMDVEDPADDELFSPVFVRHDYSRLSDEELFRNKTMAILHVLKKLVELENGVENVSCPIVNAYSISMEVLEGK